MFYIGRPKEDAGGDLETELERVLTELMLIIGVSILGAAVLVDLTLPFDVFAMFLGQELQVLR